MAKNKRTVTVDLASGKAKVTERVRSTGDADLNDLLTGVVTDRNRIEGAQMGLEVETEVIIETRKEWIVHRIAPELIVPGQFIAVPKHRQSLSGLITGDIVQGGQKIEEIWDGGAGFGGRNRFCSKRDWHIIVAGSSIPQCWSRVGTVPLAELVDM